MEPIRGEEIRDLDTYERIRPEIRKRVIEARSLRRVRIGRRISVVFETREGILYQLQETLRAEKIREPEEIAREIDLANELLAPPLHLAAVVYPDWSDPVRIGDEAEELSGLELGERLRFDLGEGVAAASRPIREGRRETKLAGAHRVLFAFAPPAAARFGDGENPAFLVLDLGERGGRSPIEGALRRALVEDLRGGASVGGASSSP